jgi:hypothetical protein
MFVARRPKDLSRNGNHLRKHTPPVEPAGARSGYGVIAG